jgi:transposase
MLTDFYGRILLAPRVVEHRRDAFDDALAALSQARRTHHLLDTVVAVERTGRYHLPVVRAYTAAGYDTRVVHPSVSRHFRQAAAYDIKTDDTDLGGIFLAAVHGFGLQEPAWDALSHALQLWARHRRDLVEKETLLRCQVLERLEAFLPGYARCFNDVFITKIALLVPRRYSTPQAVAAAGLEGLTQLAQLAGVRVQGRTLLRILGWAQNAPAPDSDAELHRQVFEALDGDRMNKKKQIHSIERELVDRLVQTPYVRLLALPGIHVVLASEFAGEAGPMVHYATARVITGRAGLYPRRYQSDQVDCASGRLARRGNRRLRQVLLMAADTLIRCNDHFRVLAAKWRDQGKDPRAIRVQVAGRFARIAFQMVLATAGFRHPACRDAAAVLSKLTEFHNEHSMNSDALGTNLRNAAAQLPAVAPSRGPVTPQAPNDHNMNNNKNSPSLQHGAAWRCAASALPEATLPRAASVREPTPQAPNDHKMINNTNEPNLQHGAARRCAAASALPEATLSRAASVRGPTAGRAHRGRGPQPLSAILPAVVQRLGGEAAKVIESQASGETP